MENVVSYQVHVVVLCMLCYCFTRLEKQCLTDFADHHHQHNVHPQQPGRTGGRRTCRWPPRRPPPRTRPCRPSCTRPPLTSRSSAEIAFIARDCQRTVCVVKSIVLFLSFVRVVVVCFFVVNAHIVILFFTHISTLRLSDFCHS